MRACGINGLNFNKLGLLVFSLLKRQRQRLLGVDISSTSVKLLELSQAGDKYRVESYAVAPLFPNTLAEGDIKDIQAVADAVKLVVARSGTSLRNAAVAVSGSSVITKVIQLDANLDEFEMEAQVSLEASRYIPYPMEEVSLDFQIIGVSEKNQDKNDVLVAASRTENVDVRVDALKLGGLNARVVDVESYAMERACPLISDQLPNGGREKTVAIIDIGSVLTTITVFHDLNTIYTREEVFGGKQLTEAIQRRYGLTFEEAGLAKKQGALADDYVPEVLDPFREALIPLIRRSLQFFFSASRFNEVDHIVLAGGGAFIPNLNELVRDRLGTPCTIANPFLDMTVASSVDAAVLSADAPSLMICCGLAMRSFIDARD